MFRFNDQAEVTFADPLPDAVDVVVVGGGVIGVSTAWFLRRRGLSVLVCEKGRVAGEQSSRNWGWVRVTGRDPDEVPIAIDSQRCWAEIAGELDEDVGFRRGGLLALAESAEEMAELESWLEIAAAHDFETQLLSSAALTQHIAVDAERWRGGIFSPGDARAEPFVAVPAIARGLQARGGLVRENCAVRTIDIEAGEVAGVVTESGRVRARAVVCAGGAWTTMFLSNAGIQLPQLVVRGTVARTVQAPEICSGSAGLTDIFIRRRQDGGYTVASEVAEHTLGANSLRYMRQFLPSRASASDLRVRVGRDVTQQPFLARRWGAGDTSPFEKHRVLNPAPSAAALKIMHLNLAERVPQLAGIEFAETWAGMIDVTPDVVPVMDAVAAHPGLFVATGFSGHGFGIGPGAGRVMADLVAGEPARFDLTRFRFSRFSDGSKILPGPAI